MFHTALRIKVMVNKIFISYSREGLSVYSRVTCVNKLAHRSIVHVKDLHHSVHLCCHILLINRVEVPVCEGIGIMTL